MPFVTCSKCKCAYEVDEADNGKECECPCGHEFKIEIVPEMKIVLVSQKPASSNKWKTLLRPKTAIPIGVICLLAVCLAVHMMQNDDNNPFRKMANSLVGLKSINRRSTALDEYLQAVKDRTERNRETDRQLMMLIAEAEISIRSIEERIARLKEEKAPHDKIELAIMELGGAKFNYEYLKELGGAKFNYEYIKELQDELDRLHAMNPMDDPAIKAAYEKQAELQNRLN